VAVALRDTVAHVHGYSLFKRLAIPHFYGQPMIFTRKGLLQFSNRLISDTSLGIHIRSLYLSKKSTFFAPDGTSGADNKALMDIVSRAPQLSRFHGYKYGTFGLSWEAFRSMAHTAGASLLEFENIPIYREKGFCRASPFHSFTALRSLIWDCRVKFNVNEGKDLVDCFPRLMSLKISRCDPSFLKLISDIE
jgi:hypothetical protein